MCKIYWMLILQFWTYPTWLVVDILYYIYFYMFTHFHWSHTTSLLAMWIYHDLWLFMIYNSSWYTICKWPQMLDISHLQSATTWTLTVSPLWGRANFPLQCCELPLLGKFCCTLENHQWLGTNGPIKLAPLLGYQWARCKMFPEFRFFETKMIRNKVDF